MSEQSNSHRLAVTIPILAACLLAPATVLASDESAWSGPKQDLDQLDRMLRTSRSTNADIIQYLNDVQRACVNTASPEQPEDASEEEIKAWEKALERFDKEREDFRDDALKLFLKALGTSDVRNDTNLRNDVNLTAAQILGDVGPRLDERDRKKLARSIQSEIESLRKAKYDPHSQVLEASFAALGHMNLTDSLEWIGDEYVHTRERERDFLVAAHKAIVLFREVPGSVRHDISKRMITIYSGLAAQARQVQTSASAQTAKRVWDAIKTVTLLAIQHLAGVPSDEVGIAIADMQGFQNWFRDHKSPHDDVWEDPETVD